MKRPAPATSGLNPRLVAAIRWDFEVGLQSMADVVRKYRMVASDRMVRAILAGETDPGIKAAQHATAWAKTSWTRRSRGRPRGVKVLTP